MTGDRSRLTRVAGKWVMVRHISGPLPQSVDFKTALTSVSINRINVASYPSASTQSSRFRARFSGNPVGPQTFPLIEIRWIYGVVDNCGLVSQEISLYRFPRGQRRGLSGFDGQAASTRLRKSIVRMECPEQLVPCCQTWDRRVQSQVCSWSVIPRQHWKLVFPAMKHQQLRYR